MHACVHMTDVDFKDNIAAWCAALTCRAAASQRLEQAASHGAGKVTAQGTLQRFTALPKRCSLLRLLQRRHPGRSQQKLISWRRLHEENRVGTGGALKLECDNSTTPSFIKRSKHKLITGCRLHKGSSGGTERHLEQGVAREGKAEGGFACLISSLAACSIHSRLIQLDRLAQSLCPSRRVPVDSCHAKSLQIPPSHAEPQYHREQQIRTSLSCKQCTPEDSSVPAPALRRPPR